MGNQLSAARNGSNKHAWDALFQALSRPSDLRKYLEETSQPQDGNTSSSTAHPDLTLSGTLQVDTALLNVSGSRNLDTATFCLGQLISHEPQYISEPP